MAICTQCGTIMHDEDMETHVHSAIPKKNEEFKITYTKVTK